eukprot:TRINITY_DN9403_c0_g1_i1.p1 TRINITY_DN9403_c0_g1~~TRINITY_DN9403_c0_g1_i1.p1  ORF type:complete len:411 (+),score=90.63 TRINITY_DN9403_c0_g1_i1:179-1234(+)
MDAAAELVASKTDSMGDLTRPQLERAYLVLVMLVNAYIWSPNDRPAEVLPSPLSILVTKVSNAIGCQPITTHYALDMFNWDLHDASLPFSLDNLKIVHTFTGTEDEKWFYAITTAIEHAGAPALEAMLKAIDSANHKEPQGVVKALETISATLVKCRAIMKRMHERLSPDVFYNDIRPFLSGWKNSTLLPNGVVYEGVQDEPMELFGASAGQSALIASFDVFFGAVHGTLEEQRKRSHYLDQMRDYIPKQHRDFLADLSKARAPVAKMLAESPDADLAQAFNQAVLSLKGLRDEHMSIVTRYILTPARKARQQQGIQGGDQGEKGTGGTDLVAFLKQVRSEGAAAALSMPE